MAIIGFLFVIAFGLLSWGATMLAADLTAWQGWVALGGGAGVGLFASHLVMNERRRDWSAYFADAYAIHVSALRDLLGPAYGTYVGVDDGWEKLKVDVVAGNKDVYDFLDKIEAEWPALRLLVSAIAKAYQHWSALLTDRLWAGAARRWLDSVWRNGEDHDEILALWIYCESARSSVASRFKNTLPLIKHRGGFSKEFMRAATGIPTHRALGRDE